MKEKGCMKTLSDVIDFLDTLGERKLPFRLGKIRDSILIEIPLEDQLWEVEFMQDGTVEAEKFVRSDPPLDAEGLRELIREFAEPGEYGAAQPGEPAEDGWGLLEALDRAEIFYTVERDKARAGLLVFAAVPGQRWRIAVNPDGPVSAERFLSSLEMLDERELDALLSSLR